MLVVAGVDHRRRVVVEVDVVIHAGVGLEPAAWIAMQL